LKFVKIREFYKNFKIRKNLFNHFWGFGPVFDWLFWCSTATVNMRLTDAVYDFT